MNKETKKILKENNILEAKMNKNNNQIYTDMIVYMRGSDISEYNQERVRRDILEMIIEGEERGDNINEVIGKDYKYVCDEIISVFPNRTSKEKVIGIIQMTLSCIYILGGISVIKTLVGNIAHKDNLLRYSLSLGDIINALVIIALANIFVNVLCKNIYKKPLIKNKVLSFFVDWVISMAIICSMIGIAYFLTFVVIKTNLVIIIILCVVTFVADKVISIKY